MTIRKTAGAVLALGLVAAACLPAAAQQKPAATIDAGVVTAPGKAVAAQSVKTTATITAIDPATRTVKMKRQDGKEVSLALSEEVRNFEQLKVGDKVSAEYTQAVALALKKGGGKASAEYGEALKRSEPGQKPATLLVEGDGAGVAISKFDAKKKSVTLKGPQGNLVDLAVEDPEQLKNIKKGDQVQAVYRESLAIKVEAAK